MHSNANTVSCIAALLSYVNPLNVMQMQAEGPSVPTRGRYSTKQEEGAEWVHFQLHTKLSKQKFFIIVSVFL